VTAVHNVHVIDSINSGNWLRAIHLVGSQNLSLPTEKGVNINTGLFYGTACNTGLHSAEIKICYN